MTHYSVLIYKHFTCFLRRFKSERIHNTKEQIYFYERAENHKAKERMFESFKHSAAGEDQGFLERGVICIKVLGFA